jgi:hypothetical protein
MLHTRNDERSRGEEERERERVEENTEVGEMGEEEESVEADGLC